MEDKVDSENNFLQSLHSQLKRQQHLSTDEDSTDCDSVESDKVVTKSQGSFGELRGLFSQAAISPTSISGKKVQRMTDARIPLNRDDKRNEENQSPGNITTTGRVNTC